MTLLKSKIHIGLAALLCFAAVAVAVMGVWGVAKAQPSTIVLQATATATTSVAYMVAGVASTTYQIDNTVFSSGKVANMQNIDEASLFLQVAASSSAANIIVTPQFSNNGIDWYSLGTATTTVTAGGTSVLAFPTTYQWVPGTTATTSIVFKLPPVPANRERIVVGSSGANAAVYMEIDLKKNPSTP